MAQTVKISYDGVAKRLQLNANEYPSFTPLLGAFPSILLAPDDIELITHSPAHRRRFLNLHLAQSDPIYVHHLSRFWRAMKQRNCLLKSKSLDTLDCWETEMAHSAEYIFHARKGFLANIKESYNALANTLSSHAETVEIRFHSTYLPQASGYEQQLRKMRNREKELGVTLQGPHRDDLFFLINTKMAKDFASEGQKKTMVTALKLAEWQHLSSQTGASPFMAIDDFGGTLDRNRQNHLSLSLQSLGQVFVTTPASPDIFPEAHHFHISKGSINESFLGI